MAMAQHPEEKDVPQQPVEPHDHWCTLTTDKGDEFVVVCNADMCEEPRCAG